MDPKVKIRMPKWQHLFSHSWAKELLMTFVGTTLSIILTFGTAHFLELKQQREDGRLAAMMVIHDMEETAKTFRAYAKADERSFNVAQYVLANAQNLDTLSRDSLHRFISYVFHSSSETYTYDDSDERVYLSSQDVWKNIDNPAFHDAAQEFFQERQVIYKEINGSKFFVKPVDQDAYYAPIIDCPNIEEQRNYTPTYVKSLLNDKFVLFYIKHSYLRQHYFNEYADDFTTFANKCKFMMGITDDELSEYVRDIKRTGKPLKERDLIGKWKVQSIANLKVNEEYLDDHAYLYHYTSLVSYSMYTGQVEFTFTLHGKWALNGDSLTVEFLPGYEMACDRSKIQYTPDKEETINALLAEWEEAYKSQLHETLDTKPYKTTYFATIDATHNKIEMREPKTGFEGETKDVANYITRIIE